MPSLKWQDADEISFVLSEKFPDRDPLAVRFTELHTMVTQLEGFADDAASSNEKVLEAIQMAWLEYYREEHG